MSVYHLLLVCFIPDQSTRSVTVMVNGYNLFCMILKNKEEERGSLITFFP